MTHYAWIAQCRTFDCVFACEDGPQQCHSLLGDLSIGLQAVGKFVGMSAKCGCEIAVTSVEPGDDILQRRHHLVFAEGQDAGENCSRP